MPVTRQREVLPHSGLIVAKSAKQHRPVFFRVCKALLIDEKTGEVMQDPRGVLVPLTAMDRRAMRTRKYHIGTELRADLKKPRNPRFWRLFHQIGIYVAENVEGFPEDAHEAVKRLQRESGVACEELETELPGVGKLLIKQARSLNFDVMDDGEFTQVYKAICRYVCEKYRTEMDEDQFAAMIEAMGDIDA